MLVTIPALTLCCNKAVRRAINFLWDGLGTLKVDGCWVTKELYLTYHTKIAHFIQKEDFDAEDAVEMAQEEWEAELRKPRSETVMRGTTGSSSPPAGVECIGYSLFFDSMFELADAQLGLGGNVKDCRGDKYSAFLMDLIHALLKQNANGTWTWADDENVFTSGGAWNLSFDSDEEADRGEGSDGATSMAQLQTWLQKMELPELASEEEVRAMVIDTIYDKLDLPREFLQMKTTAQLVVDVGTFDAVLAREEEEAARGERARSREPHA